MDSWKAIMRNVRPGAFKVKLEDVRVFARGEMGFVTCVEIIDADDSTGRCGGQRGGQRGRGGGQGYVIVCCWGWFRRR